GYFSTHFYTAAKLNDAKEDILKHNPTITKVEAINSIGGWGEWFSEYTAVVEMKSRKYRIWTYGDGEITEMEEMR
ncbi:MAG: hypothetical protein ACI33P_12790, partial [Lysinibacillus sp.]